MDKWRLFRHLNVGEQSTDTTVAVARVVVVPAGNTGDKMDTGCDVIEREAREIGCDGMLGKEAAEVVGKHGWEVRGGRCSCGRCERCWCRLKRTVLNEEGVGFLCVVDGEEVGRGNDHSEKAWIFQQHDLAVVGPVVVAFEDGWLWLNLEVRVFGGDRVHLLVIFVVEGEGARDESKKWTNFEEPLEIELHGGEEGTCQTRFDDILNGNNPIAAIVKTRRTKLWRNPCEKEAGLRFQPFADHGSR